MRSSFAGALAANSPLKTRAFWPNFSSTALRSLAAIAGGQDREAC